MTPWPVRARQLLALALLAGASLPPLAAAAGEGEESQAQIRRAYRDKADRLVQDRNYQVAVTEHYAVKTDDPRVDTRAVAELLESFRSFFDDFWSGHRELAPYDRTAGVYLFYSFYKYNELLTGQKRFGSFRPSGHYRPYFDLVVVYSDSVQPGHLPELLVHEAAHQLMEQRLFGAQAPRCLWLSEGMAAYFGYTRRDASGRFLPGEIGEKKTTLVRVKARGQGREAAERLASFRRALKKNPDFSVTEVAAVRDPAIFYGKGVEWRYSASWLLVHYLLHGDGGAHAEAFYRYLDRETRGEGGVPDLLTELELDALGLDAAYRAYVYRLKAR
jgi:hypothetical protein